MRSKKELFLKATYYNEFAFPAGMLIVNMLSDFGITAMTVQQWFTRDIFERGDEKKWKKIIDLVRTDCTDIEKMMKEIY